MNGWRRVVEFVISISSSVNVSVTHVATTAVAVSVISGSAYYVSHKKSVHDGALDQSSEVETRSSEKSKLSKKTQFSDYSNLLNKDQKLAKKMIRKNPSAASESGYNPPDYGPGPNTPYIGPESPYSSSGNGAYNNEPSYLPSSFTSSSSGLSTTDDPNVISETEGKSTAKVAEPSTGGGGYRAPQAADESHSGSGSKSTPEKSTFFASSPAANLIAGVCGEIQINVVDSSKNESSTAKNESVAFAHSTSGKFYSDSACTKEITDYFDITSGTTKFSVYYKNTKAEKISVVTSTLRNFIPQMTFDFTVIATDVNSVVLSAAQTSLKTVTCVGPFTVNQYDIYSNLATANKPLSYTVSGYGSANIYLDSVCTQTSTGTFATDGSDTGFKFYLKNSLAESLTVNVDDVGSIIASDLAIHFGPSQISITLPSSPRSGDCSAVALSLKDGLNNVTAALFDYEFTLAEASGWKFYGQGDSSCSATEITKISFAKGDSVKNIFFKPTGHGASQVTATDATSYFTMASATTSIGPRKLIWEHGALTSADYCFPMKVKAYDSEDNLAPALTAITISLTDSSASATFYSLADTDCSGAPITSATIPFGGDNVQFRFRDSVAETVNITATDAAAVLIAGTSSLVVGPNKLSIIGSSPIRSGDCNAYSVSPIDALNNPTVARQNYTLNLSDLTASGNFYASSDTSCSGAVISSINLLNGSSNANFRYKDDKAETISLNVDETTATLTSASMPVVVGPRHLDLSGTAQILSGNCVSFTIKTKDILGNFSNTAVGHTVNLSDTTPEGVFYNDSACTSATTSKAIAANVASSVIYYKNNKQQNATISTATSSGELTLASLALTIGPYKLTVAGNTETRAGDCELLTLTTQDALNNVGPVLASTIINLTDGVASGNFYSADDTTCSAATISSVTVPAGASTISYRYKNDTAESTTLASSDGVGTGLQDVNQNLSVGPRKIALTVLSSMASGVCTPVTVKTQDVNSSDKGVIRATTVNLDDGAAMGAFYSDSVCTAVVTSTALAIGSSSGTVYYKNNKAEIITLSAADSASWLVAATANTQTGPQQIILTGTTPILAGKCSAYTATTKDAANNAAGVLSATTLTLGKGSSTTATFYAAADTTCSGAAITSLSFAVGDSAKTFYLKDNKAEPISSVTASDGAAGMVDGSLAVVVGPDRLLLADTAPHRSGDCDAITIKTRDAQPSDANAVTAVTVNLTDTSATGNYYSDAACTTGITSTVVAIGTNNKVVYYKDDVKETVTLTAADSASALTTTTLNLNIGPRTINITGTTPVLAGTCQQYTVTTKDAAGTTAGVLAATTLTLGKGSSTTATFYAAADTTCSGAAITSLSFAIGDSVKTFYMKDNKAETISSVTASDGAAGMVDGSLTVVVGPDRLSLTTIATHRSGDCDAITIKTRDAQPADANAVSAVTVNLTDTTATGNFYSDSACTTGITSAIVAVGTSSKVVYYKDDVKENVTLTATDAASALTTATLSFGIGPRTINVTGTTPVLAGTCHQYTVTTKDAAGTTAGVLSATTMTLGKGTSTTATFYSAADTTCSGAAITSLSFAIGDSTKTFYMKDNKAETISSVTASDGASGMVDGALAVVVGPDRLVFTDTPPHYSGGCDAVSVIARDAQPSAANVLTATTVNLSDTTATGDFYSDAACSTSISSTVIAAGSSTKVIYYKDTKKEAVTLTGTDNASVLATATLALNIGPGNIEITGASPVRASDCTLYTVQTKDSAGNVSGVLAGTTLTLAKGSSTTAVFYAAADTTCTGAAITTLSFASGDDTKTFRMKNPKAESFTLSADDGASGLSAGSVNLVVGPSKLAITGRAGISWNYCRQYNVRARDEMNTNANALSATTLDLTQSGSVQFYADSDTTCSGAPITTLALGVGVNTVPIRIMDSVKELVTLSVADQASYLASGSLNVEIGAEKLMFTAGPTPIRSGECSIYTFESQDADGVPQNVLQNVTISTDDQTGNGFVYDSADTTCTGTAITSVTMTTGTNQKQFRYKDNTAQAVQLKVDDGAGGRDIGYYSVVVGPDHLDITGGDKISINNCTAFVITAKDTANNTANLIYDAVMDINDGVGSGEFYDTGDATCSGSTITQKTIFAGANTATVYYKNTVSELVSLTVTDSGSYLTGDTLTTEVGADRLAVTGVNYLRANECALFEVETRNASGVAQNVLADSTVSLADGAATGTLHAAADTTCSGAAISSVTVLSGTTSSQFRYKNPKAESVTFSVDDGAAGRTVGTKTITIGPNKLSLAGAATLNAGQCASYTINSKDAQDSNANVNVLTTIDLSDASAAGTFYAAADTTCSGAAITQVTIANAANTSSFRYKNSAAEAVTFTISDSASYLASATLSVAVGPGKLVLSGASPIRSGDCTVYSVVSKDLNDVVTNVAVATTVNLTKGGSTGVFYGSSDTTCSGAGVTSIQIASGSNTHNFYFKDNKAESTVITIADGTTTMLGDSRTIESTARYISLTGATSALSGSCQSYTAEIKDAAGNNINQASDLTLTLSDGMAAGDFYLVSDSSCSGSSYSSVVVAAGSSSVGFRYKNSAAESTTLTVDEGPSGLDAGTLTLLTTPNQLVISGTSPQNTGACEVFTITSKDDSGSAASVTSNVNVTLTDGAASGAFYLATDTTCAGAEITSTTILNGSSSVNVRYKSDMIENVTMNADDQAGNLISGTFLLTVGASCIGSFEVEPYVNGAVTYSLAAGQSFNIRVTAVDGGGTKMNCYSGSRTVSWSMNGSNAGSYACSETSVTPTAPSETTLNFVNGVALTTSSAAKFKALGSASVDVFAAGMNGTSSGISVLPGTICQIKIKDAASGAGNEVTSKAIDLNVNGSTPNSQASLFASGYDAFGNYVSDVSVVWSGTGAVFPWKQTTTVVDDSVKVVGVKVGTGTLKADYAGGGAGKTANVNFTVSSVNSTAYWQSSTNDILGNNLLSGNQIQHAISWNVKADASNLWRTSGSQSWRTEVFQSNARSSRADFPDHVFVVSTSSGFDIIDATNNTLWMRFNLGAGKVIDSSFGAISSFSALNGKLVLGLQLNSSVGSVVVIDFENDSVKRIDENGLYTFSGTIASRNSAGSWSLQDASKKLSHSAVNNIKADRVGSYDVFAVGSEGGITVLQFSGATLSVAKASTSGAVNAVALDTSGKIYAAEDGAGIHRYDLALPAAGTMAAARTYTNSNGVYLSGLLFNDLNVAVGTSSAQAGANSLYVGSAHGLVVINEHSTLSSVTSTVYTAAGSGSQAFGGSLYLNGSDSYATVADSGLPLGPAQGTSTAIEFWFSPSQTISSGNYTLLEKGASAGSVRIAIESGLLKFKYQDASANVTTLSSSASSWTAGEWHHVAVQIHSSGIEMWIDGADRKSAAVDLSAETLSGSGWTVGANSSAAQLFSGQIDELRVSNTVRYSGSSFVVPSAAFNSDASTVNLFHFNSRTGNQITADDSVAQTALNLVGSATWAIPKITGAEHNVRRIVLKNFSGSVNCIISSGTAAGGITEFHNSQNSASLSVYRWLLLPNIVDIFYFHEDLSTDIDYGYGSATGGLTLIRN